MSALVRGLTSVLSLVSRHQFDNVDDLTKYITQNHNSVCDGFHRIHILKVQGDEAKYELVVESDTASHEGPIAHS